MSYSATDRAGKVYVASSVLRTFDPVTGMTDNVVATAGVIPTGCPLVCLYRDRIILAGTDHVWYASRMGTPTDWDFGADPGDAARATAGQIERGGRIGEVVKAMVPNNDSTLLFATQNSLWLLSGDPATGSMRQVSSEVGVIAPFAWATTPDGIMAFLSNDGVYLTGAGSSDYPKRFSAERVPEELRNVSPTNNAISMAYDIRRKGFWLFVTDISTLGEGVTRTPSTHWWLDLDNRALWPVRMPVNFEPVVASRAQGPSGLSDVILGCRDGYLRKFSESLTTDDGTGIESHVLLGPFAVSSGDMTDAILSEIHGVLADNSGTVTWRIVTGVSAEDAADKAVAGISAALAGTTVTGVAASGSWTENRNKVERPRVRGPWCVVWLSAATPWAFETVAVRINQLGRLRA
jgi:hypothetical protein